MNNIPAKYSRDDDGEIYSPISNIKSVFWNEENDYDVYIKEYIKNAISEFESQLNIVDRIYPVGSIFVSTTNVDLTTLFPNTQWTQIQGRFLLGASSTHKAGEKDGAETVALKTTEIPGHTHSFSGSISYTKPSGTVYAQGGSPADPAIYPLNGTSTATSSFSGTTGTNNSSGTTAHNNMPPYLSVYMWERTK